VENLTGGTEHDRRIDQRQREPLRLGRLRIANEHRVATGSRREPLAVDAPRQAHHQLRMSAKRRADRALDARNPHVAPVVADGQFLAIRAPG